MPAMHAKLKKPEPPQPKRTVPDAIEALEVLLNADLTASEMKAVVDLIRQIADRAFSQAVSKQKASRDGSSLPEQVLAQQMIGRAQMRPQCCCEWLLNQNY